MSEDTTPDGTDETTAPEPETSVDTPEPEPGEEVTEPETETETDDTGGNEAARYRRRLRDTEAERDAITATLDVYRSREVETVAGEVLAAGSDLWAAGTTLADLLGDDGTVDHDKVIDTARRVASDRPHWRRVSAPVPGGPRGTMVTAASWSDALAGS